MKQLTKTFPRNQSGFSLIELLVYLTILGILMTLVVMSFTQTMQRSAQQSGIAETKIETVAGVELLRADLEHAGFGLYWQIPAVSPLPYAEPAPLAGVAAQPPRAFSSADTSASSLNTSDYLVIRATNVTRGVSGQKWGDMGRNAAHAHVGQSMGADNFAVNDRVIVLRPEISTGEYRQLVMNGATYITSIASFSSASKAITLATEAFAPEATPNDPDGQRFLVYGLNDDANISRPFNRTDYYINNANVPTHCAPNTGVLVKATANQADNTFTIMPIVDCVADFQIVYYLDTNGDGGWDQRANANGLDGLSAAQIRDQVKSVRVYILTHEGGLDRSYTYATVPTTINVGEVQADGATLEANAGRAFTLSATIGGNWANYRWKVISLAVTPKNLQ